MKVKEDSRDELKILASLEKINMMEMFQKIIEAYKKTKEEVDNV
jgi:hypothetical protein